MVGEGEYVRVSMLRNRACLLTLRDCYGDLILTLRGQKMGRLFRWMIQRKGCGPDSCPIRNRSRVVGSFTRGELMPAITVRSEQHEKVLRQEWEEAQRNGIKFEYTDYDKLVR
jgi:hypothetical protein